MSDQGLEPGGVFGLGDELPRTSDASEPETATSGFVLTGQFFKKREQLLLFHFLQPANSLVSFRMLDGAGKDLPNFFETERFLGRKEDGFQNRFKFHAGFNVRLCWFPAKEWRRVE